MCQGSFGSSYKPRAERRTGCFSTRVGSRPVVNQPKHHVSPSCFLPLDTSSNPGDTDESEKEEEKDRYGAAISAIKTNCLWRWMYIPPVISHQAKVRRERDCVFMYRGDVDVLHLIDPRQASALMVHQGDLTAELWLHTHTLQNTHPNTQKLLLTVSHNFLWLADGLH